MSSAMSGPKPEREEVAHIQRHVNLLSFLLNCAGPFLNRSQVIKLQADDDDDDDDDN